MKKLLIATMLGASLTLLGCADEDKANTSENEGNANTFANINVEYYDNGYLKEDSVERLRVTQMEIQATTAYEFSIPIAGYQKWHLGFLQEASYGDWVFYDSYKQKAPILTANITTPYTATYIDLRESPYYIEIPAGRIGGLVLDIYQRPQADLGILGPDEGAGGKYIIVGPGQQVPEGHDADFVLESNSNLVFIGTRIIGYSADDRDKLRRQHFVYKVGSDKSQQKYISASESPDWNGAPAREIQFWQDVFDVLQNEPIDAIAMNRNIWTLLRNTGISRSKGFHPDEEQTAVLTRAAIAGDAIAMVNTFSKKSYKSRHWPDRNYRYILNQQHLDLMHPDYYESKEIGSYTYEAYSTSKGMVLPTRNQGSKYLGVYIDENEKWLDGSNAYEVVVPPDAPAVDFWSFVVYDNTTRTPIINAQGDAIIGSKKANLKIEADGSVRVFLGPTAPQGYENNWVQTNVGEGFFMYFRLYGPTEAYYDKSWKLPDVKRIN